MSRCLLPRRLAVIVSLAGLVAVAGCDGESSEIRDQATLDAMRQEIEALIGTPDCDDVSSCALLPFGAKPCGGPWSYLVYSKTTVDEAELENLVARYNAFEAEVNRRYGRMSDCSVPPQPVLGCVDGTCVDVGE